MNIPKYEKDMYFSISHYDINKAYSTICNSFKSCVLKLPNMANRLDVHKEIECKN